MTRFAFTALMVVLGWSATAEAQTYYYYDPGLRAYVAYPATTVTPSGVIQAGATTVVPSTTSYYYPNSSMWNYGNYYQPYRNSYYSDSYYTTPYSNYNYGRYYYGGRGWRR